MSNRNRRQLFNKNWLPVVQEMQRTRRDRKRLKNRRRSKKPRRRRKKETWKSPSKECSKEKEHSFFKIMMMTTLNS